MPIKHALNASDPQSPLIGASDWNASHVVDASGITFFDGTTQTTAAPSTAPSSITYAATITPASGANVTYRVIMTGNLAINLPTGASDGDRIKLWLTASGGAWTVTPNASYVIPTSSVLTFPVTVASGKKAKLLFEYDGTLNGGQWEVTSFINGY
jgi:hypothetical protein